MRVTKLFGFLEDVLVVGICYGFIDRGCGFVEMSAHETNNSRMWLQGGYVCILIPKFCIKELRLGCVLIRQCKYVINICRFDVCETNAI